MIRQTIQKHFYLLTSVALVLVLCFLVGFGLMKYSAPGELQNVINNNQPYLLAWRILVYTTVIVYWPQLAHHIIFKRAEKFTPEVAYSRKSIILLCLGFEFLIVQNIAGLLFAYVF